MSYPNKFTESELTVIINNTTPEVVAKVGDGIYGTPTIGGLSSRTPIRIAFENGVNEIAVKNMGDGEYNVKIQGVIPPKVETTECFKKAVKSVSGILKVGLSPTNTIDSATWEEAFNVLDGGGMVFLHSPSGIFPCVSVNWRLIAFARTEVDSDGVYTNTYTWNSDGTVTYASQKYPSQS